MRGILFFILLGSMYMSSSAMEENNRVERFKKNYCRSAPTVFAYTSGFTLAAACTFAGIATDNSAFLLVSFAIGYTLIHKLQKNRPSRISPEQDKKFKKELLLQTL